jgi:hypothetical protein
LLGRHPAVWRHDVVAVTTRSADPEAAAGKVQSPNGAAIGPNLHFLHHSVAMGLN